MEYFYTYKNHHEMPAKRKNPGRPPVDPETLKKKINLMLSPKVITFVAELSKLTGISKSAIIESYVRRQMRRCGGDPERAAQTSHN